MKLLFIHQNFPGQFKHLAPALVSLGHEVRALHLSQTANPTTWQGVELLPYRVQRASTPNIHPWVGEIEAKVIRGHACALACQQLAAQGYTPDAVIAHPGWGESLFIKDVWPHTRLGLYAEFFYHATGADVGFDPEFAATDVLADACRMRLKNLHTLSQFEMADAAISPTHWQASTYPEHIRPRITVVHDGIDTERLVPNPTVRLSLNTQSGQSVTLTRADEVITFVNRNLEPYRGYHTFMRSLPSLLAARPHARVLIVGGDGLSYGSKPAQHGHGELSWKEVFAREVRPHISDDAWQRVHFLGHLPYDLHVAVLQLSTVHVYLTYPFVLGWSLLEAMSVGCAIVASDTQPLHEAIEHDQTGCLVNFFDHQALAAQVIELLSDQNRRQRLGDHARLFARTHYDLRSVCLPRQLAWVNDLLNASSRADSTQSNPI